MALNDQGAPFEFAEQPRSVVQLRDDDGVHWYHLSHSKKTWKLRSYADGKETVTTYPPQLADLAEDVRVVRQLPFADVTKLTGIATNVPCTDAAAWQRILSALPDNPPVGGAPGGVEKPAPTGKGPQQPFPRSFELFHLYKTLRRASSDLQQRVGEHFAEYPQRLALLFRDSVRSFAACGKRDEGFVSSNRLEEAPLPWRGFVEGTNDLTAALQHAEVGTVTDDPALNFRLVQREIVPTRALRAGARGGGEVDWLLVNNASKLPVVAEVKIRNDTNTFFGLIQALMYGSTLSTGSQMERLKAAYPGQFEFPLDREEGAEVPTVELYVVLHDTKGDDRFSELAKRIAEGLMKNSAVAAHVRQIACLDTVINDGRLTFRKRFLAQRTEGFIDE